MKVAEKTSLFPRRMDEPGCWALADTSGKPCRGPVRSRVLLSAGAGRGLPGGRACAAASASATGFSLCSPRSGQDLFPAGKRSWPLRGEHSENPVAEADAAAHARPPGRPRPAPADNSTRDRTGPRHGFPEVSASAQQPGSSIRRGNNEVFSATFMRSSCARIAPGPARPGRSGRFSRGWR